MLTTRPRQIASTTERIYTLKFKLPGWRCSRTYVFHGRHTLGDVHEAIQEAFEWDNDHLYMFTFGGRRGAGPEYGHSVCEDVPPADGVCLANLGLVEGLNFSYLFDFGDQWHVNVEVREVVRGAADFQDPHQIKAMGTPPPQYPE